MTKYFKLIKKYPTLPKNWEEGMIVSLGYTLYKPYDPKYTDGYLMSIDVENNPEFWELVEFPTGTQVRNITTSSILTKRDNGCWYKDNQTRFNDADIADKDKFYILDKPEEIDWKNLSMSDWIEETKKLDLSIKELWRHLTHSETCNLLVYAGLEGISKDKARILYNKWNNPVLFTTEDGVEIKEGDKVFGVVAGNTYIHEIIVTSNTQSLFEGKSFFSTKEAAEKYTNINKPIFSYNDILNLVEHYSDFWNNDTNIGEYAINFIRLHYLYSQLKPYKND